MKIEDRWVLSHFFHESGQVKVYERPYRTIEAKHVIPVKKQPQLFVDAKTGVTTNKEGGWLFVVCLDNIHCWYGWINTVNEHAQTHIKVTTMPGNFIIDVIEALKHHVDLSNKYIDMLEILIYENIPR